MQLVPEEGSTDRRAAGRREKGERRRGSERRGRDRRLGSDEDVARRLPDDFMRARGTPGDRTMSLVNLYWTATEEVDRLELAQALLPILEDLAGPAERVTDGHRRSCQELVVGWAARLR